VQHLLSQFDDVLKRTAFDGIHLDQYGDPKVAYDALGEVYNVDTPLAEIINATHDVVAKDRPQGDGAVVFNAVTDWPIEKVAPAKEDFVYIEVWSPYNAFTELHALIAQGQKLGGGKPVVLAAYIDPAMQANARLMEAIIYASGGGHIALGENNGYLAEAYFPKYKTLSPELAAVLKRYIEFDIRYEDVFGPTASEVTPAWQNRITVQGVQTSPSMMYDKVYPLVRENGKFTAINLVNMLGLKRGEWATLENAPTLLGAAGVDVADVTRPVKQVWFASPDGTDIALQPLTFTQQNGSLHVEIPGLRYWDMILIEWGD
jgi:dextranase